MNDRTRAALVIWGKGDAASEGLAADVLAAEGYVVEPMHPQGGPDKRRDGICEKAGRRFTMACYFPNNSNQISFKDMKEKFLHDLEGVSTASAEGVVFVTNVSVADAERIILEELAAERGCAAIVYHLEKLRVVLDSAAGLGARVRYLEIDLTREEQLTAFTMISRLTEEIQGLRAYMRGELIDEMKKTIHETVAAAIKSKKEGM
jgi:hypothetical protein